MYLLFIVMRRMSFYCWRRMCEMCCMLKHIRTDRFYLKLQSSSALHRQIEGNPVLHSNETHLCLFWFDFEHIGTYQSYDLYALAAWNVQFEFQSHLSSFHSIGRKFLFCVRVIFSGWSFRHQPSALASNKIEICTHLSMAWHAIFLHYIAYQSCHFMMFQIELFECNRRI